MILCGCSTHTETVPVEIHSEMMVRDTAKNVRIITLRDSSATHTETSTVIRDSIAPIIDSVGRLIGYDRYHYRETTRRTDNRSKQLMAIIDSLKQVNESIQYREKPVPYPVVKEVAYPVVKEVERKKTWWEKTLNTLGQTTLVILALLTLATLAHLYHKYRKR